MGLYKQLLIGQDQLKELEELCPKFLQYTIHFGDSALKEKEKDKYEGTHVKRVHANIKEFYCTKCEFAAIETGNLKSMQAENYLGVSALMEPMD